jgi:hypothetical protein
VGPGAPDPTDRVDQVDGSGKAARTGKVDGVELTDRVDRADVTDRADRADQAPKADRAGRADRQAERAERADRGPALDALVSGRHTDPHGLLGVHDEGGRGHRVLRAWWPGASSATYDDRAMVTVHPGGVFELYLDPDEVPAPGYTVTYGFLAGSEGDETASPDHERTVVEPWAFWPRWGPSTST